MRKSKRKKKGGSHNEWVLLNSSNLNNESSNIYEFVGEEGINIVKSEKVIGVSTIRGYKIKGKSIILLGDPHLGLQLNKVNDSVNILMLDLFKKNVIENNGKCFDLFLEQFVMHLDNSQYIPREVEEYDIIEKDDEDKKKIENKYIGGTKRLDYKGYCEREIPHVIDTLSLWRNDPDIVNCSKHYINKYSINHRLYKGRCMFENLRVHNIDIRLPLTIDSYVKNMRVYYRDFKNDVLDGFFNVMIMSECEKDLIDFLKNGFIGLDYSPYIELWRLLRKEERKSVLNHEELLNIKEFLLDVTLNLEDYKRHVKSINILNEEEMGRYYDNGRRLLSFLLDYYSILRMFLNYDLDSERKDYIEESELVRRNINISGYASREILELSDKRKGKRGAIGCQNKNNDNIVYYVGGGHLINISILLEHMGGELYLDGNINRSHIGTELGLENIVKKSGGEFINITNLDEIFSD